MPQEDADNGASLMAASTPPPVDQQEQKTVTVSEKEEQDCENENTKGKKFGDFLDRLKQGEAQKQKWQNMLLDEKKRTMELENAAKKAATEAGEATKRVATQKEALKAQQEKLAGDKRDRDGLLGQLKQAREKMGEERKLIDEAKKQEFSAEREAAKQKGKEEACEKILEQVQQEEDDMFKGLENYEQRDEELRNKIAELDNEITALEKEITELEQRLQQAEQQLDNLENELDDLETDLEETNAIRKDAEEQIAQLTQAIQKLSAEITDEKTTEKQELQKATEFEAEAEKKRQEGDQLYQQMMVLAAAAAAVASFFSFGLAGGAIASAFTALASMLRAQKYAEADRCTRQAADARAKAEAAKMRRQAKEELRRQHQQQLQQQTIRRDEAIVKQKQLTDRIRSTKEAIKQKKDVIETTNNALRNSKDLLLKHESEKAAFQQERELLGKSKAEIEVKLENIRASKKTAVDAFQAAQQHRSQMEGNVKLTKENIRQHVTGLRNANVAVIRQQRAETEQQREVQVAQCTEALKATENSYQQALGSNQAVLNKALEERAVHVQKYAETFDRECAVVHRKIEKQQKKHEEQKQNEEKPKKVKHEKEEVSAKPQKKAAVAVAK